MVVNNRVFSCKWTCLKEGWALVGVVCLVSVETKHIRKEDTRGIRCATHLDIPQSPRSLEDFSPCYVRNVWCLATHTGTNF